MSKQSMDDLCEQFHLLHDDGNVVRIPMLVKGKLVVPPKSLDECLVLKEPIVDRATMQPTGEFQTQVLPRVQPLDLIERDASALRELYDLPFTEVLAYLRGLNQAMAEGYRVMDRVKEITRKTAPHPDAFHDSAFAAFPMVLSPEVAEATVNLELAYGNIAGSKLLDGYVDLDTDVFPGMTAMLGAGLFEQDLQLDKPAIRAMPTRQLHITAGNAPAIPVFSMLRAIALKSPAVIKSPFGAIMPGALAALAAASFAPDHPITKHLSLVYWPGGDRSVEDILLAPMAFDRVVVWGSPDSVKSVQERAGFTRVISFNPRYGLSMIGKEAFAGDLRKVAIKASLDALIWNQKACTASFVQYVEGDAKLYAETLREVLARWDEIVPNYMAPEAAGTLRRMKRGKYMNAQWHSNAASNVILMEGKFDMLDHPMHRNIIIRPVRDLSEVIETLHHGVASIGIYPESRRRELRDLCFAHGVSNVLPLGQVERSFAGMPHDGMRVLADLVDWKHA